MMFGHVAYYVPSNRANWIQDLIECLGSAKVLLLRNHGAIVCGKFDEGLRCYEKQYW